MRKASPAENKNGGWVDVLASFYAINRSILPVLDAKYALSDAKISEKIFLFEQTLNLLYFFI